MIGFETIEDIRLLGFEPTTARIRALDAGAQGNLQPDTSLYISPTILNVDTTARVVELTGGVDTEGDEVLRIRVLERIRAAATWRGTTRLCALGEGSTGRDAGVVRSERNGHRHHHRSLHDGRAARRSRWLSHAPATSPSCEAYLDTVRPVAVKDLFVVAPIPQPIDVFVDELVPDTDVDARRNNTERQGHAVRCGRRQARRFLRPGNITPSWKRRGSKASV